jgi:hypothetical protein
VEALRTVGFDDRAILDICQVASYFAFVNRMADGLGVELEGEESAGLGDRPSKGPERPVFVLRHSLLW